MVGKSQVVVGAEINDFVVTDLDRRPLGSLKLALALVEALVGEILQLLLQNFSNAFAAHDGLLS